MNSSGKEKDFIDKIIDFCDEYKASGVRFLALIISFILLFLLGCLFAPMLIKSLHDKAVYVQFMQISPFEVLYNYIKVAFFFAFFLILPFFLYQFGKLKVEIDTQEEKASRMSVAFMFLLFIFASAILTYVIVYPFEMTILYGLNFSIATLATSLSAVISTFLFTYFTVLMLLLLPYMHYLIRNSKFFNYAQLTGYKKPVMIYFAVLTAIIALPLEIIGIVIVFLPFYIWYKILVHYSKKRD